MTQEKTPRYLTFLVALAETVMSIHTDAGDSDPTSMVNSFEITEAADGVVWVTGECWSFTMRFDGGFWTIDPPK